MMNGEKKFLPYHQILKEEVIVVDGLHPEALVLSHWKGANIHKEIEADTSGEIVLNAIQKEIKGLEKEYISATHFDIDGFVGVFALFYPELANQYEAILREMAIIGDFREFDPHNPNSVKALQLCCWMNKVEKELFYEPFGHKDEIESCVPKFNYFLKTFDQVLLHPEKFSKDWKEEYEEVLEGLEKIEDHQKVGSIDLWIIKASEPLHYYTLFSKSSGSDIVLSIYPRNSYEVELKYTTWVDIASRASFPRIDLRPFADQLNEIEQSGQYWQVDKISDTGPILRLEKDKLSKAQRYANPTERMIYPSTIEEDQFTSMLIEYLEKAYEGIERKRFWTWEEMREINKQLTT